MIIRTNNVTREVLVRVFSILIVLTFAVLLRATCSFADESTPTAGERVRVVIARSSDRIVLTLPSDTTLTTIEGRSIQPLSVVTVLLESQKLLLDGEQTDQVHITTPSILRIFGKGYRGTFDIFVQQGRIVVVNEIPLEEYLVGVITSEIASSWPEEAIKAQAVIARTYALTKKRERQAGRFHLESTVMDQVYNGVDRDDDKARKGVRDTSAEVLTYEGKTIQAFYHANSGGQTESALNAFGVDIPYLRGVECMYGLMYPGSRWEWTVSAKRLTELLQAGGASLSAANEIIPGEMNNRGRRVSVTIITDRGQIIMPGTKFRMMVGSTLLKSTNFSVLHSGDNFVFTGAGYGHGVGLCQYGMKQRALDGFSYAEILSYYYPGTTLVRLVSGSAAP